MASTEAREEITNQQDKTVITNGKDAAITEPNDRDSNSEVTPIEQPVFRAVGIIKGEVKFSDEGKTSVIISKFEYGLECNKKHFNALSGLKKEIASTGQTTQRLIVYPKVMHFPRKEMPHKIWFQLIGFDQGRYETGISTELADNEFKLCGLWQFIPVCRPPCISIFLNFKQEQLGEPIEQAPLFMKLPKSVKGQVRKNSSKQQKKNSHQKPKPNLTNKIIPQSFRLFSTQMSHGLTFVLGGLVHD